MRYLRCECGKAERWDSGEAVAPCSGCRKCGTTFATSKEGHKPLEPHDWKPRYDADTGEPTQRMCKSCYRIERMPAP